MYLPTLLTSLVPTSWYLSGRAEPAPRAVVRAPRSWPLLTRTQTRTRAWTRVLERVLDHGSMVTIERRGIDAHWHAHAVPGAADGGRGGAIVWYRELECSQCSAPIRDQSRCAMEGGAGSLAPAWGEGSEATLSLTVRAGGKTMTKSTVQDCIGCT